MSILSQIGEWASRVLLPLGAGGLFAAAILDSTFLPFPSGVDLWFISLTILQPARMPFYAIVASVGSVIGSSVLFFLARKGEEVFIEKRLKNHRANRVRQWTEKYGSFAVFIAALLPPPAPFKLFVASAGLLKMRYTKFFVALLVGRLARYFLVGLLAVRYGRQAWDLLLSAGPSVFIAMAMGFVLWLIISFVRRKTTAARN